MKLVHKASTGIPGMINRVCEKSLVYGSQQQKRLVDDYMVKFVVEHECELCIKVTLKPPGSISPLLTQIKRRHSIMSTT